MFGKTNCLMVFNRTGRFTQCRSSIRKSSHLKYSAASVVKKDPYSQRSFNNHASSATSQEAEGDTSSSSSTEFGLNHTESKYGDDRVLGNKKVKLDELISRAEDILSCRFHRSRSSPIGVGLSPPDCQEQPYFSLLPTWFTGTGESSLIASRIPALLGSGHPILRLKQNIDPDDKDHALTLLSNNVQWRAFVILLVSKAFGHARGLHNENKQSLELKEARIKTLCEITEMMHFAFALHRTIVEIKHSTDVAMDEKESSLQLGNKVAILFGDLLLSRTSKGLSSLKSSRVTELMSDAISDFSESEILRRRHYEFFETGLSNSNCYSSSNKGGNADSFKNVSESGKSINTLSTQLEVPSLESWRARVSLDIASLIGRSCLSSTLLSQLDEGAQNLAFNIGRQIGLLIQAYNDLESFTRGKNRTHPSIDLCTLPVVFHLRSDSIERIRKPVDVSEIYHGVMSSPEALLQSQIAIENLKDEALRLISTLPHNTTAPDILKEFVQTLS